MIGKHSYTDSTVILSKAIGLDPYSEEMTSMIMKAYGAAGDFKSVKYYYDKMKNILKEELDTELSSETEDLYNKIIHREL
jgi:pentatricopeptide repeat protein